MMRQLPSPHIAAHHLMPVLPCCLDYCSLRSKRPVVTLGIGIRLIMGTSIYMPVDVITIYVVFCWHYVARVV